MIFRHMCLSMYCIDQEPVKTFMGANTDIFIKYLNDVTCYSYINLLFYIFVRD